MTGKYAIISHPDGDRKRWYAVHEIYLNATGKVVAWSEKPVSLGAETPVGIVGLMSTIFSDCASSLVGSQEFALTQVMKAEDMPRAGVKT